MLLLRSAKRGKWYREEEDGSEVRISPDDHEAVARALTDFAPRPDDQGELSVYRVESIEEAERLVVEHELEYTKTPRHGDYVLFPGECLGTSISARKAPDETIENPLLREHHWVIVAVTDDGFSALVKNIVSERTAVIDRVAKSRIAAERARRQAET